MGKRNTFLKIILSVMMVFLLVGCSNNRKSITTEEFKDKAMHNEKFWALYLSENLRLILKRFDKAESKTEKVGL